MEVYEIINNLLDEKQNSKRDFAKKINTQLVDKIPEPTIYQYLNGRRKIPTELRIPISKALGEPLSAIFRDEETITLLKEYIKNPSEEIKNLIAQHSNLGSTVAIPTFEAVAGCGAEGMLEQLKFNKKMNIDKEFLPNNLNASTLALIRIVGDSMEQYLSENDWALIQLRNNNNVVYANSVYLVAHGDSVQIKRCQFKPDGSCLLISDNKAYEPEIAYAGDWDVVGKVVGRVKFGSGFEFK
ncbi:MAG: LexA family transcriptional regulator [Campylobacteraceae bacterium]|nr:LexA family transcriptional regulator [Campylobacteraceae bacterium]